jgi:hypothetical protein
MAARQRRGVTDADETTKQRGNWRVTMAARKRLNIHAIMSGKEPGELLTELIETHLRQWRVQENTHGSVKVEDRIDAADDVSLTVLPMAG